MRAGEARRPRADHGDPLAGRRAARERRFASLDHWVRRVALQEADRDRLAFGHLAHAGLLAERLGRTDAGARAAHDVGVKNGLGRSVAIARGDLTYEQRNVDRSRAGLLTGRVEAEVAALRLNPCLVPGQRGMKIGEAGFYACLVEATRGDVGESWRVGRDRHCVSLTALRTGMFLTSRSTFARGLASVKPGAIVPGFSLSTRVLALAADSMPREPRRSEASRR